MQKLVSLLGFLKDLKIVSLNLSGKTVTALYILDHFKTLGTSELRTVAYMHSERTNET